MCDTQFIWSAALTSYVYNLWRHLLFVKLIIIIIILNTLENASY